MRKLLITLFVFNAVGMGQKMDYRTQIMNKPEVDIREYAWSRTSGSGMTGNLSTTGVKVVNLKSCPYGLAVGNFIRISEGTGTAESVAITGISGNAGAACTITFTTAQTHTGSWKLGTATSGIQEAFMVPNKAERIAIIVPSGSHQIYATINFPAKSGLTLQGSGGYASNLMISPNFDVVKIPAGVYYPTIKDLSFQADTSYTTGWAITFLGAAFPLVQNVKIQFMPNGIKALNCTQLHIEDVEIREPKAATGIGIHIDSGGYEIANLRNVQILGNPGARPLSCVDVYNVSSFKVLQSELMQCRYAMRLIPGAGQVVTSVSFVDTDFDNSEIDGLLIKPTGFGVVERVRISNSWAASSQTGNGINMIADQGAIQDISITNTKVIFNRVNGIVANGVRDLVLNGNSIYANSWGAEQIASGIALIGGVTNCVVSNNIIGSKRPSFDTQLYSIVLTAEQTDECVITGNTLVRPINDQSTGLIKYVQGNIGVNAGVVDMASAASLDLGYSANHYRLSGTTTVTKLLKGWGNRTVTFTKNDAGSISLATGGGVDGIMTTVALPQNGIVNCMYDQSIKVWYCK